MGGAERALDGHDIPDGFLGAHSTGVIVSFQSTFHAVGTAAGRAGTHRQVGDFSYSPAMKTVAVVFPQEVKSYL